MSTLTIALCKLSLLCAAGAAGFALGRADVPAPHGPASPPWVFDPSLPRSTAVDNLDRARWYPTVKPLDRKQQDETDMYPRTTSFTSGTLGALSGPGWRQ